MSTLTQNTENIRKLIRQIENLPNAGNAGNVSGTDVEETVWNILEAIDLAHRAFVDDNTLFTDNYGAIYVF